MKRLVLLALLLASPPSMAQDTDLIPRAVVQFDGTHWAGTFTQAANTITVTQSNDSSPLADERTPKEVQVGDLVWLDFSSGPADASFEVVSTSGTTFTVAAPAGSSSGNVTIRVHVRYRANISSVRYVSAGWYEINFATPFQSNRYAAVGGQRYWKTEHDSILNMTPQSSGTFVAQFWHTGGGRDDAEYASFAFYGKLVGEP
jgi:hypothetical protein